MKTLREAANQRARLFSLARIEVKDIDYEGFQLFMDSYLEIPTPRDLVTRLFLSFVKRPTATQATPSVDGRLLKMAAVTSTTACAPITSHTTAGGGGGSLPELAKEPPVKEHQSLAEKLHGFTEKLTSSLGHRCDSESNSRGRAGNGSSKRKSNIQADKAKALNVSKQTRKLVQSLHSGKILKLEHHSVLQ
ncbi:hypothetical protein AVEN_205087-1 [Araneus ventricosus]|uniref:Diacylglycerol kinase type I N-terminal domain-containing protein n=1 Tax=Araneus ventricosus TaxID=182803 RepID=A0A4Y2H1D3_ARAVE|nr:hypothetical protein AVEN_205087-1 [Araneus ventricosus]